ncbi:hypothetical protein AB0J68_23995 [Micromonospora sp. NPDC049580]
MPQLPGDPDNKRHPLTTTAVGGVVSGLVRAATERLIQLIEDMTHNT